MFVLKFYINRTLSN